jgi:DEAD/DEAH box helicase domain-containing protein
MTLGAYAKPCNHRYFTRPLSSLKITVVKQMERVDLVTGQPSYQPVQQPDPLALFSSDGVDASFGSFAGCGVVTVKRNVHGYKKVSIVTRDEISRSELSLPDMEFDTFAVWIDCDPSGIGKSMTQDEFAHGIHALSHAICNVSPLFVPCVINDVQCDHAVYKPTRVVIFDARAGGSGIVAQLWRHVFRPDGLIHAAIDLLDSCSSCADDRGYTGGCPACIQVGECIKFNDFLCRRSALIIAQHMLSRMQTTDLYKKNEIDLKAVEEAEMDIDIVKESSSQMPPRKRSVAKEAMSPRRRKRERAMRAAKDMDHARQRQVVVGRPSWPMDRSEGSPRQQQEE